MLVKLDRVDRELNIIYITN